MKININITHPLIILLVGESGSGKSRVARYIKNNFGFSVVQSYTERPMREEEKLKYQDERDHIFVPPGTYETVDKSSIVAHANWNGFNYWAAKDQLQGACVYIVDEGGMDRVVEHFENEYGATYPLRVCCDKALRLERCGGDMERLLRDDGKFTKDTHGDFGSIIDTGDNISIIEASINEDLTQILSHYSSLYDINKHNY